MRDDAGLDWCSGDADETAPRYSFFLPPPTPKHNITTPRSLVTFRGFVPLLVPDLIEEDWDAI